MAAWCVVAAWWLCGGYVVVCGGRVVVCGGRVVVCGSTSLAERTAPHGTTHAHLWSWHEADAPFLCSPRIGQMFVLPSRHKAARRGATLPHVELPSHRSALAAK